VVEIFEECPHHGGYVDAMVSVKAFVFGSQGGLAHDLGYLVVLQYDAVLFVIETVEFLGASTIIDDRSAMFWKVTDGSYGRDAMEINSEAAQHEAEDQKKEEPASFFE
jgi:hypothetical protein